MFAVEVELLTDRYVATSYNDRDRAEWPPHPARFFSALVATWAEAESPPAEERRALEWLARQPAPCVLATVASPRTVAPVFVPVNDVETVSQPHRAREKLAAAESALEAARSKGDERAERRAEAALAKAREKLRTDTEKAVAASRSAAESAGARAKAHALLPEGRTRQPRTFPSVTPDDARFVLRWGESPPDDVRAALGALCARLVRVGHSSSLVRAAVVDRLPPAPGALVLVPDDQGVEVLRAPGRDQMQRLLDEHVRHQGVQPRVLPCRFVRYSQQAPAPPAAIPHSLFEDEGWIVFARREGPRLPGLRVVDVARALRGALLRHATDPPPPLLSGHESDGSPLAAPHLAILPLPYVASRHADGQILGVAIVFPRAADAAGRRAALRAIGAFEDAARAHLRGKGDAHDPDSPPLRLTMGRAGEMVIQRVAFGTRHAATLDPRTWSRPSRRWATATPIALDKNPGNLHDADPRRRQMAFAEAEECVRVSCQRIGLPIPLGVDVLRSAVMPGSEKPTRFPPFPADRDKTRRVLVHARLLFDGPVSGPVLLGAGRYLGLGLCRPVQERG